MKNHFVRQRQISKKVCREHSPPELLVVRTLTIENGCRNFLSSHFSEEENV